MIAIRKIIDRLLIVLIYVYVLYTFWFQYGFKPIPGLLSIVGILMLFCSISSLHIDFDYYKEIIPVGAFVLYCLLSQFLVSDNKELSINLVFQIVKYCIPLFAIYQYVGKSENRLNQVMLSLIIGCSILAVWSFFAPVYNMTYSSTQIVEDGKLNANVFSSYMMVGVMSCTYFLRKETKYKKILLYALLFVIIMAQLNAASRRGILICVFIVVAYFHTILIEKSDQSHAKKIFAVLMAITVLTVIINEFSSLSDTFLGLQRLQGHFIGGDERRRYYQYVALSIFKQSPILGRGLGSVSNAIGMYSHSLYFELLACTGLIGTLIILVYLSKYIVKYGKQSLRKFENNSEVRVFSRLMFWYVIALLMCGIAVVLIYDSYFYIVIAIFACGVKVMQNLKIRQDDVVR